MANSPSIAKQFGPQPFTDPQPPEFYECGCCGHLHPANWNGDCRDDANRFTFNELDDKYSPEGWTEVDVYDESTYLARAARTRPERGKAKRRS